MKGVYESLDFGYPEVTSPQGRLYQYFFRQEKAGIEITERDKWLGLIKKEEGKSFEQIEQS